MVKSIWIRSKEYWDADIPKYADGELFTVTIWCGGTFQTEGFVCYQGGSKMTFDFVYMRSLNNSTLKKMSDKFGVVGSRKYFLLIGLAFKPLLDDEDIKIRALYYKYRCREMTLYVENEVCPWMGDGLILTLILRVGVSLRVVLRVVRRVVLRVVSGSESEKSKNESGKGNGSESGKGGVCENEQSEQERQKDEDDFLDSDYDFRNSSSDDDDDALFSENVDAGASGGEDGDSSTDSDDDVVE
ncbi:ABC-2 type transporter family protein, partial [Striga asiatica]